MAIELHLAVCTACFAELEEIQQVDRQLDLWKSEKTPDDFWTRVMTEVGPISDQLINPEKLSLTKGVLVPRENERHLGQLLRDLVAAAAITLVLFWNTAPLMGESKLLSTGKIVNGMVSAYDRVTDTVWQQASEVMGEYTHKLFIREE
jgi:hypothetical protein